MEASPASWPRSYAAPSFIRGTGLWRMRREGLFDHAAAERLVARQAELSEDTGCPAVLHIYARTHQAFLRYLDFAEEVWEGPFIIDSADSATRARAASTVSELGYADRAIYNSISLATDEAEARAISESEIDSAIVLAYNPGEPRSGRSSAGFGDRRFGPGEGPDPPGQRARNRQSAHRSRGRANGQRGRSQSPLLRRCQSTPRSARRFRHSQCSERLAVAVAKRK